MVKLLQNYNFTTDLSMNPFFLTPESINRSINEKKTAAKLAAGA